MPIKPRPFTEGKTIRQRRRVRRLYVFLIRHDLMSGQGKALYTYAKRMQDLGMYSQTMGLFDIQRSIMGYLAQIHGHRHWGTFFTATKTNWNIWRSTT